MEQESLQGQSVVVTGAGRGIGRALALAFAAKGAHVLVHYGQSQEQAEEVAHSICEQGGKAEALQADIGDTRAVTHLVAEAVRILGKIDVWINNAGASANSAEAQGLDEIQRFERMMRVDVEGTWRCCREVRPHMREGSCIINMGWDGALVGAPGLPNQLYAMSKGAIISLTRCLALEYAPQVRVNCIAPGWIENAWAREHASPAFYQHVEERIPLKRWGKVEDIVGVALFLSSPVASYITGQVIPVNGGDVRH
ncbi:SDR family NAD(P)-dependent oxidoreductase [Ktedonospora formicarum]|uniref:Short-chain dehydrogenase n=1 Tax=Ktedonospora formicarum TaxID=2778364 RepID=A0A8J3MS56_9CHLR|nr:SDR family oxidoreductase [Ktedonospora formicarum]GHO44263.1 short-chain dehydrogenase [Ktedonospora formicarum]